MGADLFLDSVLGDTVNRPDLAEVAHVLFDTFAFVQLDADHASGWNCDLDIQNQLTNLLKRLRSFVLG